MSLLYGLLGLGVVALSAATVYLYSYMWFLHEGRAYKIYTENPLTGTILYVGGLLLFTVVAGTISRGLK